MKRVLTWLLVVAVSWSATGMAGISIGLETRVPPFVFKDGRDITAFPALTPHQVNMWESVLAELSEYGNWGAKWNIVTVYQWHDDPGQLLWLRRVIDFHRAHGLDIALRLMESPAVYAELAPAASPEYGYHREYHDWVRKIAQNFGAEVLYFFIGNETETGVHGESKGAGSKKMPVTYEQYGKLLQTAVKAIKSVDGSIKVANCGFSDYPLALAVADDIYRHQGLVDAQAFWASWKRSGGKSVEGLLGVYRLLHDEKTRRMIRFVRQAVTEPLGSDVMQLHFYGGSSALPVMLQWVQRQMQESGTVRPIVASEVGYYVDSELVWEDGRSHWQMDMNAYSPLEHAEKTVRDFAILLGAGVQHALYWHMRARDNRAMVAALFKPTRKPDEFVPTRAAMAFRMLAVTLDGLSVAASRLATAEGLWQAHFTGAREVTIAWADPPRQMDLPAAVTQVLDMYGNPKQTATRLELGADPVYLLWDSGHPLH